MPSIEAGPDVDGSRTIGLYFSLASGLIAFVALVFSLLFLVVPYANTNLTPRLTLFRDNPVVWHSFAFFISVFVFLARRHPDRDHRRRRTRARRALHR